MTKRRRASRPAGPATAIAYVHPGTVTSTFAYSLMRLMVYEIGRTGGPPAVIAQRAGSGQLVEARNETVRFFLEETPAEWLWFVDTDMGFAHDTLQGLLVSADKDARPVVGGLCFGLKKAGQDDALQSTRFQTFPTLYRWRETAETVGFEVIPDYPRNALVQVSSSGAACFLAHRQTLEAMRDRFGDEWFTQAVHPTGNTTFSEDMSFFMRLNAMDVPVFVNTAIKTSHDKGGIFYTEETFDDQQALARLALDAEQTSAA